MFRFDTDCITMGRIVENYFYWKACFIRKPKFRIIISLTILDFLFNELTLNSPDFYTIDT
ncbi:MAG: hypothetical protein ACJAUO_001859 [Sediminicola sp.]|jgi:hypothetical protein